MRLLAKEGVEGARLFPGFDGVVKGLQERYLWEKKRDGLAPRDRLPTGTAAASDS